MIPQVLDIEGFLSYKEHTEILFYDIDIACITGENGAGKSSILEAMTWALFGRARKKDESIINLHCDKAKVAFYFEYEGNEYRVIRENPRGKSQTVELFIAGKKDWVDLTERTLRETNDKIADILKLDYECFVNAIFFLQGDADQFSKQTPANRKKILGKILGLEAWEDYRLKAREQRAELEKKITGGEAVVAHHNEVIADEEQRKWRLNEAKLKREAAQANYDQALEVFEGAKESQRKIKEGTDLVKNLTDGDRKLAREINELETDILGLEDAVSEYNMALSNEESITQAWEEYRGWEREVKELSIKHREWTELEVSKQTPSTEISEQKGALLAEQLALKEAGERVKKLREQLPEEEAEFIALQNRVEILSDSAIEVTRIEEALHKARERNASLAHSIEWYEGELEKYAERLAMLEDETVHECPTCKQEIDGELYTRLLTEAHTEYDNCRYQLTQLKEGQVESLGDEVDLELQLENLNEIIADMKGVEIRCERMGERIQAMRMDLDQWETHDQPRLKEIERMLEQGDFAHEARDYLKDVEDKQKALGYDPARFAELDDLLTANKYQQRDWEFLQQAKAEHGSTKAEMAGLVKAKYKLEQEREQNADAILEARKKLETELANAVDYEHAEKAMKRCETEVVNALNEEGKAQALLDAVAESKDEINRIASEQETIRKKARDLKVLEDAFGKNGVPALMIEQTIPAIQDKANELLDRLSGGEMRVEFITQAEYKSKDAIKETLDIVIEDKDGVRDYEMFSGGEAFRINFAIRVALSNLLAQRAGARLQTLVIDEGFGSQDSNGRDRLVEAISVVRNDFAKVLVITHIEELKDLFPHQIQVVKTLDGSKVEVKNWN